MNLCREWKHLSTYLNKKKLILVVVVSETDVDIVGVLCIEIIGILY
jgi:hypothetical protein